MAVPIAVPNLGEEMAGGLVAEWYHPDGAIVDAGEAVCRVESSFVAVDIEADETGLLRHRLPAGSIERPGAILGVILAPNESMPPEESFHQEPASMLAVAEPAESSTPSEGAKPEAAPESTPPTLALVDDDFVADVLEDAIASPPSEGLGPLPEFEEALIEAVVVPFPLKFSGTPGRSWDEVPGDSVEFDSGLFGDGIDESVAIPEPGGTIPGLPLWTPEEPTALRSEAAPQDDEAGQRFGRISREAHASAQVLTMTMTVNLKEAERMRSAFEREWHPGGPQPMLEDVIFRAIAWALEDTPFAGGIGAIIVATPDSDLAFALREPASRSFRDAVTARAAVGDEAFESASWLLVSLAALGVSSATPHLEPGRGMSFALGAEDEANRASLKMAYDSTRWSEGSAARLLKRVRDILDLPYAMLT
ncbi:MAG: biotin/lipoyl-containing protein [bacterium]